ncbi:methionine ABC transporter ATP-binding protein [Eupransor demetentiae]|uniref:ATPase component (AbcC) n=1 Tax=Eupransor demetentiae TaxID=3109584 RepID=A0ABP0EQN0_9LACO|nr:ABC-type methionine transport system [Lactobacillaceae bacterium LMG 33000]
MSETIISLKNIDVSFVQKQRTINAVQDVSLDVNAGDVYGIVGYSGAGKSTLVRTINLLQEPTKGSVVVDGKTFFNKGEGSTKRIGKGQLRQERRKIGMIFQHFNLLNERTVAENVAFALEHSPLKEKERDAKVKELLALVELSDRAEQYPSQLSGGQKQRVAIARALANDPKILISDEATSALDPKTTNQILELLKKLNQEYGLTILLITHEMEAVKAIANKVAVMQDGQIIERGSLLDIFANPKETLTQEFIETTTNLNQTIKVISEQPFVQQLLPNEIFARLDYTGKSTNKALIASIYREYQVQANILYGNIEVLQGNEVGSLLVVLSGPAGNLQDAIADLVQQGVGVEILKGAKAL